MSAYLKRPKCVGLMGWLFGHRFTVNSGDYSYRLGYCGRCGLRAEVGE